MDPLLSFKLQIEAMFEKSFQDLDQKNNLNKTILNNLMNAANDQSRKISQLDNKMEHLQIVYKGQNQPQAAYLKKEVKKHQEIVHQNFNKMMERLQQIQQGINNSRKHMETNIRINQQSQEKMNKLIYQLEEIQKKQNIPQYRGDRNQLLKEIQEFQNILNDELEKEKNFKENIQFSKKTTLQPINTFQTKMALHNKANEEILKEKLTNFTDKIRKLQKKVQETTWMMNSQISKSNQQQRKIIEEMNLLQHQMGKLRHELQGVDQTRKQTMQTHAMSLDNMVEEMLTQAKKLEVRVQTLRKGYEDQNEKLTKQIYNQKMTI